MRLPVSQICTESYISIIYKFNLKNQTFEKILEIINLGHRDFGENRIQEAKNSTVVLLLDGTVQFYNAQLTLVKQLKSFTIRATLFATQQEAKEKTQ